MLRGGCHRRQVDDHDSQPRAPGYRTGRMEAFSDGVFAIAVTLLVLEIAVPAGSGDDLLGALGDQWPSYLGYLVSFATIGAVWFAHTVITEYLDHADSVLIRLNLLLLLVVSFLPFPTKSSTTDGGAVPLALGPGRHSGARGAAPLHIYPEPQRRVVSQPPVGSADATRRLMPQRIVGLVIRAGLVHRELTPVELEVLGAIVIDVEQAHRVGEVGVPADREVHATGQCIVGLPLQVPMEGGDGSIELPGEPRTVEDERASA
jgi:hypothetical protein